MRTLQKLKKAIDEEINDINEATVYVRKFQHHWLVSISRFNRSLLLNVINKEKKNIAISL